MTAERTARECLYDRAQRALTDGVPMLDVLDALDAVRLSVSEAESRLAVVIRYAPRGRRMEVAR